MATLRLSFMSSAALELLATLSVALVAVTVGLRLAAARLDLCPGSSRSSWRPRRTGRSAESGREFHSAADGAQALDRIIGELETPTSRCGPAPPDIGVVMTDVGYRYPGTARTSCAT